MPTPMRWSLPSQGNTSVALWRMQGKTATCGRLPVKAKPKQLGPMLVSRTEPEIQWRDYDRIKPGVYPAYCRWARHYRDPGLKRWTCLARFDVLSHDLVRVLARVPWWLNLGEREKPHASRRGKYLKEWVRANGGPPMRGDRLSPKVFCHRMARVEVGDTDANRSPVPYSVVKKIIEWETGPLRGHSVIKSHSQGRHGLNHAERQSYQK
jgi:hypothetical protein